MPVYLFTWHAYGSWMPDRKQGYVHHTRGLQPQSIAMAHAYRSRQLEESAHFDQRTQGFIIDAVRNASPHINMTLHGMIVDVSHVHALVSWSHEREWRSMRTSIRTAISRTLNAHLGTRTWLSREGSRRRVRDQQHFDHLLLKYLPSHGGTHWFCTRDVESAKQRAPA